MQKMNEENSIFRVGKYILLVGYMLLGFVLAWRFNSSLSFLQGMGIVLYVLGAIILRRYLGNRHHFSGVKMSSGPSEPEKPLIVRDLLMIAACYVAAFVVMVVGTLANPRTETGFYIVFEAPILILILIVIALISRIVFRLLNMKRYFKR